MNEEVDAKIKSLVESASKIDIKRPESSHVSLMPLSAMPENAINDKLDFAEPNDIMLMQKYLGISKEDILLDSNIETMRLLTYMARSVDIPLYSFLLSIGNKIGGRLSAGFADRFRTYIKLLIEHDDMVTTARELIGSRHAKKQLQSDISKIAS
mgnify:CR=1 FL=1